MGLSSRTRRPPAPSCGSSRADFAFADHMSDLVDGAARQALQDEMVYTLPYAGGFLG